jgi:hypothetical protein
MTQGSTKSRKTSQKQQETPESVTDLGSAEIGVE